MKKNKGLTLIELAIVLAVAGMLFYGIITIMKKAFDIWHLSIVNIDIQQKGRAALEEMTVYIRQSSNPVTGISPAIGETDTAISFTYIKDDGNYIPMKYYKGGDALYRVFNGNTTTLVKSNVESIYFVHESSYVVKISSFTLKRRASTGEESITFNRTINIRNQ